MNIDQVIARLQEIREEEGSGVRLEAHNPAGDIDFMDCLILRRDLDGKATVIFGRECDANDYQLD